MEPKAKQNPDYNTLLKLWSQFDRFAVILNSLFIII